ncbi:MAG: class I SAM-dependent methyltransferase [Candidatus Brocadiales bacterium]
MLSHFSRVASEYRQVRTTDVEPIAFIGEMLKDFPEVKAADVGCGAGRYDLLLFQHIKNLHLTCIDINKSMLNQVSDYLSSHGIIDFEIIEANANDNIPLEENAMDCIFTFNAIHHFDFVKFIEKSARVIKKGGRVFIYTRLREQNTRNIWGQYFSLFSEKENRLHELVEMKREARSVDLLTLETAKPFKFRRKATLGHLINQVNARHYSTFSLYEDNELEKALREFQENIKKNFQDTNRIEWYDENILLVLKRKQD